MSESIRKSTMRYLKEAIESGSETDAMLFVLSLEDLIKDVIRETLDEGNK